MRKCARNIEEVKQYINNLCGVPLKISVNKGRKKILKYNGSILAVYPQVFTLKLNNVKSHELLSCSYSDVICGDIKLTEAK